MSDVLSIRGCGGRDYMKAGLIGQLYGISANIAGAPVDKYGLTSGYVRVIEKHLPSRDTHDRSGRRLDEVQGLWFLRHHFGRSQRTFRISPGELFVGSSVYLITSPESGNARPDCVDDSRHLGAENEGQVLVKLTLALTNERIPRAYSRRFYANQELPLLGFWTRQVIVFDDARWTEV
jgi:hypothetical protein